MSISVLWSARQKAPGLSQGRAAFGCLVCRFTQHVLVGRIALHEIAPLQKADLDVAKPAAILQALPSPAPGIEDAGLLRVDPVEDGPCAEIALLGRFTDEPGRLPDAPAVFVVAPCAG